ncbi:hypothetical protein [Aliamphritea spongicola]|nr:hypothetical protein [Aliamphritea spongicola]
MPATYTPLEMDELELLLEALYRFCDYDLRQYGRRSLMRLIQNVLAEHGLEHVSDLIPLVAHDLAFRRNVIDRLTVSYSVMFRDPELFKRLEEDVLLYLQSFPDYQSGLPAALMVKRSIHWRSYWQKPVCWSVPSCMRRI